MRRIAMFLLLAAPVAAQNRPTLRDYGQLPLVLSSRTKGRWMHVPVSGADAGWDAVPHGARGGVCGARRCAGADPAGPCRETAVRSGAGADWGH